jgi:hypothetical protein
VSAPRVAQRRRTVRFADDVVAGDFLVADFFVADFLVVVVFVVGRFAALEAVAEVRFGGLTVLDGDSCFATSRFGALMRHASRNSSASSSQSVRGESMYTPTQPYGPTYGGTKKRSGAACTMSVWFVIVALTQTPSRPSPWCESGAAYIANIVFTRNVGVPHASTSRASGSARQSWRRRASGRGGMGARARSYCDARAWMSIHDVPKRSRSIAKRSAKNVSCIGMKS